MPPAYILNTLVHLVNLVIYSVTVYYASHVLHIPFLENKFSKFNPGMIQFLTIWNLILQPIFFLMCLLNDLFGTNAINPEKPPFIRKLKDYFHASLGFPISIFASMMFWTLIFVDRELLLPKALDLAISLWMNHLMHTLPMVTIVLEMIVAPRQYPKRSRSLGILATFLLTYLVWIHVIYYKSGVWVYPIIEMLPQPLRVIFFAMMMAFCMILYFIGETLNNIIWGNKYTKHKKSQAKSK